eukprot:TRINITY_DN1786_c0_g1_i1.p1 TRINITY_DN1786_c0_g1~~TRINITY_DN1786_c0_g1_i1.p1  ORF type:complete len:618 (+),score=198.90 TRINITY_DN1786_c0_g1_i1:76-1854(+)
MPGTAQVSAAQAQELRGQHREKLAIYARALRGEVPFFTDVVITAGDAEQTATYESNIAELRKAGRIPDQPRYTVVPDPPGRRVGCGGATFYVLRELKKLAPEGKMEQLVVLLIHAGGYSKRLPNHSHCGKIFSLLPVPAPADPRAAMTMLELKLATFAHVPAQVPSGRGGVLTTCSDDLIFYDHSVCDFSREGFTAFGHPSPVTIGKDHGVFVLSEPTQKAGVVECTKFLHKPPIDKQVAEKAVVGKTGDGADEVYTDSSYFFSGDVAGALLALFEGGFGGQVQAEVDAYGDFMHPLGPGASMDYMGDFGNTAKADDAGERDALQKARRLIYDALKGRSLYCLALPGSRFYHVGTIAEAIHHFCEDEGFLTSLGRGEDAAPSRLPAGKVCAMESIVAPGAVVGAEAGGPDAGTVLEYSRIGAGCRVGSQCVLSGIELPPGTSVPEGTFLQTLPLRADALPEAVREAARARGLSGAVLYATHCLGSLDDIKKGSPEGKPLPIFGGRDARQWLQLPAGASLWTSRLFPVCASPGEALQGALECARAVREGAGCPPCWAEQGRGLLVSLADCCQAKCLPEQHRTRQALLEDIAKL